MIITLWVPKVSYTSKDSPKDIESIGKGHFLGGVCHTRTFPCTTVSRKQQKIARNEEKTLIELAKMNNELRMILFPICKGYFEPTFLLCTNIH